MVLNCWDEASFLNKLLNRPIFRNAGKLSLSIYVNHALIARILEARLSHSGMSPLIQNTLYATALTLWSLLSLFLVEKVQNHNSHS